MQITTLGTFSHIGMAQFFFLQINKIICVICSWFQIIRLDWIRFSLEFVKHFLGGQLCCFFRICVLDLYLMSLLCKNR